MNSTEQHEHNAECGREQPLNENQGREPVNLDADARDMLRLLFGVLLAAAVMWAVIIVRGVA